MASSYSRESEFEDELIAYLQTVGNVKQWRYEPDIKTIDDLWNNFRLILNRNNADKLGGVPLTDAEFSQVKEVISSLSTPYEAGQWLYGMNGVTQVEINRDEPDEKNPSGHIYLTVFDQDQIGAGNTVYQIVNQIRRPHVKEGRRDSRFDTTLLINGLPIIHIEEKADRHDAAEALNQIESYIESGAFTEIYSTLQIVVAMTPHSIRYMANATVEDFHKDFAFQWQEAETGEPVMDWKRFCQLMLSIPMAHQMAVNYMILDGDPRHRKLMVMRPYQVYATKRVIEAVKTHSFGNGSPQEIGYVWHTTGSGKTVSSFKAAWLASRLPNVDKVVFVVDRKALTSQTFDNYRAYDPDNTDESFGNVADTANTTELQRKLKSRERSNSIIVTSIQKLDRLVKRQSFQSTDQHIVFIVDEAHRSTNGDMLKRIKRAFPMSAWVGYTGTPAFDGDLTHTAFGDMLHAYTIREAIADRNVLGFRVEFEHTLSDDTIKDDLLPELLKHQYPSWDERQIAEKIARITPDEVDKLIDSGIYDDNQDHVSAVVDDIYEHWRNRSHDNRYSAILTTHVGGGKASASMAMMYFDEFNRRNAEREMENKPPLRVAITFSYDTSNSNSMLEKNRGLRRAMSEYNKQFDTYFDDTTAEEYFNDVVSRLQGKIDGPKLDLVIVIDQLLTGFDAKMVNTLYVDRTLSGANLIQAYSRTNRIDNFRDKPQGRIVNYRWPRVSKRLMDAALRTYANRDSALVQGEINVDTQDKELKQDGILAQDYGTLVQEVSTVVQSLRQMTDGFNKLPESEATRSQYVQEYGHFNSLIGAIKDCNEFDYEHPDKLYEQIGLTADEESVAFAFWTDAKRYECDGENPPSLYELDFHAQRISEVVINYDYLNELLAKLINAKHDGDEQVVEETREQLAHATNQMADRVQAQKYQRFADGVVDGSITLEKHKYPVESSHIEELMDKRQIDEFRLELLEFREKWGIVDRRETRSLIEIMLRRHVLGTDDLNLDDSLAKLTRLAVQNYKEESRDPEIVQLRKIQYSNQLRDAFTQFADHIVEYFPTIYASPQSKRPIQA